MSGDTRWTDIAAPAAALLMALAEFLTAVGAIVALVREMRRPANNRSDQ
jgi:hypothetical protein